MGHRWKGFKTLLFNLKLSVESAAAGWGTSPGAVVQRDEGPSSRHALESGGFGRREIRP